MEDAGESLSSPIIPYPGKQLLPGSVEHFFCLKPGIKDRYIYDLGLSTGEVMYECKGGMGLSTEKHILGLHDLIKKPYAESLIVEEFETNFKGKWGKAKYYRTRRDLNQELKSPSRRTFAKLYCLMSSSGFIHKFDQDGNFKCEYFPHTLDTSEIKIKNKKLINSDFIINSGDFTSFDNNLLTKRSLVYFHVPFPYTETLKKKVFEFFDHIDLIGYDFLVSSRLINRGRMEESIKSWSSGYSSIQVPFNSSSTFSDIFITNF
jgi:hypothetical protein